MEQSPSLPSSAVSPNASPAVSPAVSPAAMALGKIRVQGKTFFSRKENIALAEELARDPRNVEALVAGLNFEDDGLKQPCTTLALMLKIGRKYPVESTVILEEALRNRRAPLHYLCELVYKINKRV